MTLKLGFDQGEVGAADPLDRNDKLLETLTVRSAKFCPDEYGAAVHVIGPPVISLGEIE
jgi:hypothetical protein